MPAEQLLTARLSVFLSETRSVRARKRIRELTTELSN